jgi:hypothetical protein
VLAALLWIPPVARLFALVPSASQWFGVLWLAPLLILLADDLRKAISRKPVARALCRS